MKWNTERTLSSAAVLFYLFRAGELVYRQTPYDTLWSCHVGCLLVGIGLLARAPWALSVGFLWLVLGLPIWVLDLTTGGTFFVTSTLTHIGGLAIAIWGLRRIRMPRGAFLAGVAGLAALWWLTRLVTPPGPNVNLSHAVWPGWEQQFPSYPLYILMFAGLSLVAFFVLEVVVRRFWWRASQP